MSKALEFVRSKFTVHQVQFLNYLIGEINYGIIISR